MDASNDLTFSAIVSIISAIVTVIGASVAIYKVKPERRKLEADSSASLADAAESVASGAKISNELLLTRIQELEERENKRSADFSDLKKRFEVVLTELADYKDWTRRLVHQIKSLGHEPVSFKPKKEAAKV